MKALEVTFLRSLFWLKVTMKALEVTFLRSLFWLKELLRCPSIQMESLTFSGIDN